MREASENGREALRILRDHYAGKGKPRIISLYTELTSLRKEENEGVTDYIIRTEATVTALRNAGETLSDGLIIAMVLKGLPRTFNAFSIYLTHSSKELTFSVFKTQLRSFQDTDKYHQNSNDDNVMKLTNSSSKMSNKVSCFECNGKGHVAKICPNNFKKNKKCCNYCKCQTHIKNCDDPFQPDNHFIELVDGTKTNGVALKRGDAEICLVNANGNMESVTLKGALLIPSYPQDIFSIKSATANGAAITFKKNKNELIHKNGTKFNIFVHNRLYYLMSITNKSEDSYQGCYDINTWHRILGHSLENYQM